MIKFRDTDDFVVLGIVFFSFFLLEFISFALAFFGYRFGYIVGEASLAGLFVTYLTRKIIEHRNGEKW